MTGIFFYCLVGLLVLSFYRLYDDEYSFIHHFIDNYFISITSRKRFIIFLRFIVFILWPIPAVIACIISIFYVIRFFFKGLLMLFFED